MANNIKRWIWGGCIQDATYPLPPRWNARLVQSLLYIPAGFNLRWNNVNKQKHVVYLYCRNVTLNKT